MRHKMRIAAAAASNNKLIIPPAGKGAGRLDQAKAGCCMADGKSPKTEAKGLLGHITGPFLDKIRQFML